MLKMTIFYCFAVVTGIEIGSLAVRKNWIGLVQRALLITILLILLAQ